MSVLYSILFGAVQGATAFFPAGSTGILNLIANAAGLGRSYNLVFLVMLHAGTALAAAFFFIDDVVKLAVSAAGMAADGFYNIRVFFSGKERRAYRKILSDQYRRFALAILGSLIPAYIIGYLIRPVAEMVTGHLLVSGVGLFITALLLFVSSFAVYSSKTPKNTKPADSFLIGAFQGFSCFPGLSRTGTASSAAFLGGLTRKFTLKYCYLLCIPMALGALVLEGASSPQLFIAAGIPQCIAGMLTAFATGLLMIRFAVRLFGRRLNRLFAVFTLAAGIISLVCYMI